MFSSVCKSLELDEDIVRSGNRDANLVQARNIYFKSAKENYKRKYSLEEIGSVVERDHATVLHGVKTINLDIEQEYKGAKINYLKTVHDVHRSKGRSASKIARLNIANLEQKVKDERRFINLVNSAVPLEVFKDIDEVILSASITHFRKALTDNLQQPGEYSFKVGEFTMNAYFNTEEVMNKLSIGKRNDYTRSVNNVILLSLECWQGNKDYFTLTANQINEFTNKLNITNGTK